VGTGHGTLRFLQVNEAAVLKYKYTKAEFLQMKIIDVKFNSNADHVHADMSRSKETGIPQTLFSLHIKKDGGVFHVEVIFNAIPFNGRPAILAISNDLTERMEYLASIQLQNEKLQQIAWIQSHEVRSPLASILGLAQLYSDELPRNQISEIMQRIMDCAGKLDKVIKETVAKI
jgi:PAS domain S-box-containing protein